MAKFYSLIDGSGYIFRAYYALPPMTNPKGTPIGAVYGFCSMLLKVLEEKANHFDGTGNGEVIAIILDAHRKTFRNDIYPDYKANRSKTPEELIPQFPLIRKAIEAFQLPCIEQLNYEADDLIATYANHAQQLGAKTRIISSDKDLMQLINDDVLMFDPMKQKLIDSKEVFKKFGVNPDKIIEVQSLIGDSSDNVPGVSGIGLKGACELINQYGSLENLLDKVEEIKQPKRRQTLIEQRDIALMSKQLVTLKKDVPLNTNIDNLTCCEIKLEPLLEFFKEHGFNSLIPRAKNIIEKLNKHNNEHSNSNTIVKPVIETKTEVENKVDTMTQEQDFSLSLNVNTIKKDYKLIRTEKDLQNIVNEAMNKNAIAIDTETTGIDSLVAKIIGISIAIEEGRSFYIPLRHTDPDKLTGLDLFSDGNGSNLLENQIPIDKALEILKPLLENTKVKKVFNLFIT